MALHLREIIASGAFALIAGAILWPPTSEFVYWTVFDSIGDAVILLVVVASIVAGFVFGALSAVSPRSFAVGGTLAYLSGMGAIEVVLTPDSPVHFLLYGSILIGMGGGVVGAAAALGASLTARTLLER